MTDNQNEGLIDLVTFHQFMFDNVVPIDDIEDFKGEPITKILPYWRKNELLPFIRKGLHFKISFAELIWLRILDTLRQLSYSIEQTRKVCDYFFKDAYEGDLPKKNLENHRRALTVKRKAGTITVEEEDLLKYLEHSLKDDILLYLLKSDINYLTNLTIDCIRSREDRNILIFADGRVGELYNGRMYNHRGEQPDPAEPHICLSLSYYLREFINSAELSTLFIHQILNDNEKKVMKEMKNRNIKEITILIEKGNIKRIKSTREGVISGEQAKQIKQILGLTNYQQITLDTRDESTFSFKKTNKKI